MENSGKQPDPAAQASTPRRQRRWRALKWGLTGAAVAVLGVILLGVAVYRSQPDRNARDAVAAVMQNEYGAYSDENEGWLYRDERATFVMHVLSETQVDLDGTPRLLLGVAGQVLGDDVELLGTIQYRYFVVDMRGKNAETLQYWSTSGSIRNPLPVQRVEVSLFRPGKGLYGWQLDYDYGEGSEESAQLSSRDLFVLDAKRERIVYSGALPLRFDNSGICKQSLPEASRPVTPETEAGASMVVAANEPDEAPEPATPCERKTVSYTLKPQPGSLVDALVAQAEVEESGARRTVVGLVRFDPHSFKLRMPASISGLFNGAD
ncbi:hypothetical protein [Jeongeupia chitinilytica]|nr:hypothetical protein [Jeongeupia chitinilytica]